MKELQKYLSKIGKRGGEKTKKNHGSDYYAKIGAKGKESRRLKKLKLLKEAVDRQSNTPI